MRSTAGNVGDRLPDVIESVKASATEGARTVRQWPESTQRLAAAFSLGLGVGLTIAGAPRLLVAGSLVPAIAVAATIARPRAEAHEPLTPDLRRSQPCRHRRLRLNGTVIDPAEAVRSARDFQAPDAREILRNLDSVPGRVDTAISAAGDSLRETGDQIRGTIHELSAPRRDRRLPIAWPWLVGLAVGFTIIGVGAWWFRRSSSPAILDDDWT